MIGPSNAVLGSPFPVTMFSESPSLTVYAEVIKVDDGTSTSLILSREASLSSGNKSVYRADFTPSVIGWYVIQYRAVSSGTEVFSTVSRLYADQAASSSGSGSATGATASSSSSGKSLSVPALLDGTSGTFTFTVGNS